MAGKWAPTHAIGVVRLDNPAHVETKLMTHVPDLVIFDKNASKIPHVNKFDGVLLFADVSGFTALTEKYTQSSEKGTDSLTVTLNAYIGKIVQNILQQGGDILKFAGDAILAVWKVSKREYLSYAISQAAKCSLTIQDKCDNQLTDVGVNLRVKIAISAGKIYSTFVGNADCRYFVMAGRPVGEVNAAEKYCSAGLVVLSPNALELSEKDNIIFDSLSERFGLVRYLRHGPRKSWHEYADLPEGHSYLDTNRSISRVALRLAPSQKREEVIRKYITKVVQRKLDDNQPLKFLSEMRQCSIAFINMAFELNERDRRFHEIQCQDMQNAFDIIHSCTSDMQGSLNKIFMFDKGCTFLVIFGLPGDKHEDETAHALQASWRITQGLKQLESIKYVSIGVTTGPVFCGVIGHEERHEYTVIGQKVNLAARLMMHYPGIVSCDADTFNDSKLSKDMFTALPQKDMKGCGKVTVYEYTEGVRKPVGKTTLVEPEYPILGREEEVNTIMRELTNLKNNQALGSVRRVIVLEGESGYGKSRVMEEIQWRACKEDVRVVAFPLSLNDAKTPFFTLKTLLDLLLGLQSNRERSVRERVIWSAVDPEDRKLLFLFNDIMDVNFSWLEEISTTRDESTIREMHSMVVKIVHKVAGSKFLLFALDDAQNIDEGSWKYITTLSKDSRALCVLAMQPFNTEKPPCENATQIIGHPNTMHIKLTALPDEQMGALSCQTLDVQRIPLQLERLVTERSHGVPRWCEQLLREMKKAGLILIVPLTKNKPSAHQNYAVVNANLTRRVVDREIISQPDVSFNVTAPDDDCDKLSNRRTSRNDSIFSIPSALLQFRPNSTSVDLGPCRQEQGSSGHRPDDEHRGENFQPQPIPRKHRLQSWSERISWPKSSSTLVDFLRNTSKTKIKEKVSDIQVGTSDHKVDSPMECIIKSGFDIFKFPVPASIRSMALARLDRMEQHDQLIVKCAAVIGSNCSRRMLRSIVPGYEEEKFQNSIFQLMSLRVFQCASSAGSLEAMSHTQTTFGRISHRITCGCHERSDNKEQTQEEIAAKCDQLVFINSLVQETAYDLWLENQRKSLHEACACFLESKIDEVLITGRTDDVITKQFRLSRKLSVSGYNMIFAVCSSHFSPLSDGQPRKSSWRLRALSTQSSGSEKLELKSSSVSKTSETNRRSEASNNGMDPHRSRANVAQVSSTVIGRMNVDRVGAHKSLCQPMPLKDECMPDDYISSVDADEVALFMAQAKALNVDIKSAIATESNVDSPLTQNKNNQSSSRGRRGNAAINSIAEAGTEDRRMSFSPLWSQAVGLSSSHDRLLQSSENEARRLDGFKLNKVFQTPYEMHDVFALLHPQLVHHWKKAKNTQKTIHYLLKAGESFIATFLLDEALQHLEEASEIVRNLGKGIDIVAKVNEEDDDGGIEDVKVLTVSRHVKAQVHSLLGQVLYQQGKLVQAKKHFLKALSIMKCGLPSNVFTICARMWHENNIQNLHLKHPSKYIGRADSSLANRYIEQVRCLSYVWQILLSLKKVPHRVMLAKLIAVMQVNRAEAADDDLLELITSYTYLMQMHQMTGGLGQSALYENKATLRCLELPRKLTAPDMYITGHLHLVSCSIRLCTGKLAHATSSGYRAYNVADTLQDFSIKILVLPILAQIHLLTGRGSAYDVILNLLKSISTISNDENGLMWYYCACVDSLLGGGYSHEPSSNCVEYIKNSEGLNIGEMSRLYARANMALWCSRREDMQQARAWLELAEKVLPDFLDNFHATHAFTRIVESHLIRFRSAIETQGLKHKETAKVEQRCRFHLRRLSKLCKRFPVLRPRQMHYKAYLHMLIGQSNKAREKVTLAASTARYCGNVIDRQHAAHSLQLWFSPLLISEDDVEYWVTKCDRFPEWSLASKEDHSNRQYSLKLPMTYF